MKRFREDMESIKVREENPGLFWRLGYSGGALELILGENRNMGTA